MTTRVRTEWSGDRYAEAVRTAALTRGLPAAAAVVESRMKTNLAGPGPSAPGQPPGQETGQLKQSITYNLTGAKARIGTNLVYGRWLEYGVAAITPKNGRALAVPVNQTAKRLQRRGIVADAITGLFKRAGLRSLGVDFAFVKRPGKPPLLIEKTATGKLKTNGAIFVLKSVVRLAARPWALRSLLETTADQQAAFSVATAKELRRVSESFK